MAEVKITALPLHTAMNVLDLFAIVDDPSGTAVTKRMSYQGMLNGIAQLTEITSGYSGDNDDLLMLDGTLAKVTTLNNFFAGIEDALAQLSAIPASGDTFLIIDGGVAKYIEMNEFIKARYVGLPVGALATNLAIGNRQAWFKVPPEMAGMNLVFAGAEVQTAPTDADLQVQVHNYTSAQNMLSTGLVIDAGDTADGGTTSPIIDSAQDDLTVGDLVGVDIDQVGSTLTGEDLLVTMGFDWP